MADTQAELPSSVVVAIARGQEATPVTEDSHTSTCSYRTVVKEDQLLHAWRSVWYTVHCKKWPHFHTCHVNFDTIVDR